MLKAYSTLDFSVHLFKVHFTMKLTYRTVPNDEDDNDVQENEVEFTQAGSSPRGDIRNRTQWDDDCPWSEWYSAEDPIKGFELVAMWSEKVVENSLEMAELENSSPHEAEKWILYPNLSPNLIDGSQGSWVCFATQLCLLVDALDMSFTAQFMEDFVSVESPGSENVKSSSIIPPPTVIDRVLKELFQEGGQLPNFTDGEHKTSRAIKGAPLQSLFAQFCLRSVWFGNCNIRAIAVVWVEFVREVRWCWEELQPLPRMPTDGSIDLSTCLINQKLHMLAICIERKRELTEDFQDCIGSNDHFSTNLEVSMENSTVGEDSSTMQTTDEDFSRKRDR
ncbi:Rab3 GTPase-activating protein catalytic subunit [Parasponia andersonii]|uniref:Rab3 GTPase-activating protein catalytic subunit n=1 Tax=Parasponia andersonii TaxID=3476 RepID=A0A2P5CFS3_PARAD|nr:Rab3 GTPase-activating protein catalytic subunit [Parasponia andersonii]